MWKFLWEHLPETLVLLLFVSFIGLVAWLLFAGIPARQHRFHEFDLKRRAECVRAGGAVMPGPATWSCALRCPAAVER